MQNKNPNSTFGIDINEYTQNVNFQTLATNIDFLYIRSSGSGTGRFRVDRKFLEYAKAARNYGIPVGAYHFGVPSYDLTTADSQCNDFINILQEGFGNKNYGDLLPVLDVELPVDNKISTKALIDWIERFRKCFEKKTRRRLMLYTGAFFIELYNDFKLPDGSQPLKSMPLWIAMYTNVPINPPYPPDLGGWKRWRIWQYSEGETVQGVGNPVDANWGPDNLDLLMQPKQVRNLNAVKEGGMLKVTWSKNTDSDLLGYNIFENGYWIGTVDKEDTSFEIKISQLPVKTNVPVTISIEAFDYDGETSQVRTKVTV
ncbi:MAG: glycoside hydrolase family 25 protein [Clostridium sp.]|uniref:glycoside hydrolase family 25 protein n=2 Tax=Clostridium sp. TaxID=1506 RepID=UPI0025E56EE5|nr:glycoside hydrolase family 25 protein [Clostridium sp.]MDY6228217.1 glycoside hydrolase family 25 protein [Clostridium sp.]